MDAMVAAALYRGSEVLLCHRSPTRRSFPDVWDFPGGHVEAGEAPHAALVRELREELAVEVSESALAAQPVHHVTDMGFCLSLWRIDAWVGEPVNAAPEEHDRIQWFGLAEALELELAHPTYSVLLREWAGVQLLP